MCIILTICTCLDRWGVARNQTAEPEGHRWQSCGHMHAKVHVTAFFFRQGATPPPLIIVCSALLTGGWTKSCVHGNTGVTYGNSLKTKSTICACTRKWYGWLFKALDSRCRAYGFRSESWPLSAVFCRALLFFVPQKVLFSLSTELCYLKRTCSCLTDVKWCLL